MTDQNLNFEIILNHVKTVRRAFEDGTIDKLRSRDCDQYDVIQVDFPFGTRTCLKRKDRHAYLMLQKARCGSVELDEALTLQDHLDNVVKLSEELGEDDKIRCAELHEIDKRGTAKVFSPNQKFAELGFRIPKLLRLYKERYGMEPTGFDVIDSNVAVAKLLGYDARVYDFNDCSENLDLGDIDLIISYHMLEHVTNPLTAVKTIYEAMKPGAFFHVEIPIEPGFPNVRYCHMYPFHPGDMHEMLKLAGFKLLTLSHEVPKGGPNVERYLAVK